MLIAEQLAASGARAVLGLTSAGQVWPGLPIPSLVVARRALCDEGTSFHYLPPGAEVDGDAALGLALEAELAGLGLPVVAGTVWTTDAPYRETAEQLGRHAARGVLAVEMQAASLFAFGAARRDGGGCRRGPGWAPLAISVGGFNGVLWRWGGGRCPPAETGAGSVGRQGAGAQASA